MKHRTTDVVVRRARAGDLDAVVAMRCALIESSSENPINRNLRRDFRDRAAPFFAGQLDDPRCLTLLAVHADRTIGLLRCMLSSANPLHDPPRHGYVLSVYVEPEYRRRGVLSALVRQAETWCASQGVVEIRLHCAVENSDGNAAWQALGFEAAETLRVRRIPQRRPGSKSDATDDHRAEARNRL